MIVIFIFGILFSLANPKTSFASNSCEQKMWSCDECQNNQAPNNPICVIDYIKYCTQEYWVKQKCLPPNQGGGAKPTPVPKDTPILTPIVETPTITIPTQIPTNPPSENPTETPKPNNPNPTSPPSTNTPAPAATSVPVGGGNPVSNPLVEGIRESYGGQVLGDTSAPQTHDITSRSELLPTNNVLSNHSISIPSLNLNEPVYESQKLGSQLLVGHNQILVNFDFGIPIFYAHNGNDKFGKLWEIKMGEDILINEKSYIVETISYVSSSQTSLLNDFDKQKIALITCQYTNPNNRIIVIAKAK